MAIIEMNFMSESLKRVVTVNAIIPFDKLAMPGEPKQDHRPFKTLYLLHGLMGNHTDWLTGTRIKRWAEDKNLAVIMPSGENHFYVDCKANGERFSQFIGQELPEKMRTVFPLSDKREDTFIAGLSMGGYGAITNGLRHHETFGYTAGLSSALVLEQMLSNEAELAKNLFGPQWSETVFGDLSKLKGSDKDYYALAEKQKDLAEKTQLYICCGTEDGLLERNRQFAKFVEALGLPLVYEEGPGGHDWDFWDTYIKKVLDWLPLDEKSEGRHS